MKLKDMYAELQLEQRRQEDRILYIKKDLKKIKELEADMEKFKENVDNRLQNMEEYLAHIGLTMVKEGKTSFQNFRGTTLH